MNCPCDSNPGKQWPGNRMLSQGRLVSGRGSWTQFQQVLRLGTIPLCLAYLSHRVPSLSWTQEPSPHIPLLSINMWI